jgi:hypothetical protein
METLSFIVLAAAAIGFLVSIGVMVKLMKSKEL